MTREEPELFTELVISLLFCDFETGVDLAFYDCLSYSVRTGRSYLLIFVTQENEIVISVILNFSVREQLP